MRVLSFCGPFVGLIVCSLAQDFSDSPKIWQKDGQGGRVWNDNPTFKGPDESRLSGVVARAENLDDGDSTFPAQGEAQQKPKFPANIAGLIQQVVTQKQDMGKQYMSCLCSQNFPIRI